MPWSDTMRAFLLLCAVNMAPRADLPAHLDWSAVARLAREQAPEVQVARAKRAEVRALQDSAAFPASGNPELALTAGPGYAYAGRPPALEFMVLVTWPFDLSGSARARQHLADQHGREMDAQQQEAARLAVGEALDLFVRARGALDWVQVAETRTKLDAELVRIARVRRAAGDVGDGDLALAQVVQADGMAFLRHALGEQSATLAELATRLNLDLPDVTDVPLAEITLPPAPSAPQMHDASATRPDVQRAAVACNSAESDHAVQRKIGRVVPRVTVGGGRGPEYQGELGLTVPLPVYQRNQTNVAVARAHIDTARVEHALARRAAAGEVLAARARFDNAQAAYALREASRAAVDDAEHLALRAFELGQDGLSRTVVTRREVMNARAALQDAKIALARAAVALCTATDTCAAETDR